ncbi:tetratricopeptide repeat protein [Actinosynnema sp. NPDC050801]|uniref:tetratricopeptide repeat protein n=1 Tax=unclassified Actinosynnema TaxID=2637065 RepID=UPI0033F0E63C
MTRSSAVLSEVADLEAFTSRMRALDDRYGGASARAAAVDRLPAAVGLLDTSAPGPAKTRLYTAVADLHSVAGWASFDTGVSEAATEYFGTALRIASSIGDTSVTADVYCRMGRMSLHHNDPTRALEEFRLGGLAARTSGSPQTVALIRANTAWARARLGQEHSALALLADLDEALVHPSGDPAPGRPASNDLSSLTGIVYTELAQVADPRYARLAVLLLTAALNGHGTDMARSRAFSLISLAACHLLEDRVDAGVEIGSHAVDVCEQLASHRTVERLRPLRNEAQRRQSHHGARNLADRIRAFRPPPSSRGGTSEIPEEPTT